MKRWNKPEISNLGLELTKEYDAEPIKSESSCTGTEYEAGLNKGKGCSVTYCQYYDKNNNGNGNGGKCGGPKNIPIS